MKKLLLLCVGMFSFLPSFSQTVPTFESQVLHKLSKEDLIRIEKLKNVPISPVYRTRAGETFVPHDYTRGFFLTNEDWYGYRNSTILHFDDDFKVEYETVKKNNPGKSLGCTNQFSMIWGDKMFCVSKQDQDPGEKTVVGARFTVLDKNTMKILKQFKTFPNGADGRGCVGVSPNKVYVGTSSGIVVYDIDKQEFTKTIENTGATNPKDLYHGQIGSMIRLYDYVYAVHQSRGLLIIDPTTDKLISEFKPKFEAKKANGKPKDLGFGSVVCSLDGRLWLSVCDPSGSGQAYKVLECYDPKTKQHTVVKVPGEFYGPANSWYAWTPDGFCSSTQNNVLYWNGGKNSWFSNKMIFKYDIDENKFSKFIDLGDSSPWKMYGCSFRINPLTDESVMSQYKDFGVKDYQVVQYDTNGNESKKVTLDPQFWFPTIPVFPDQSDPSERVSFFGGEQFNDDAVLQASLGVTKLSLKNIAYDFDNMECLMTKWVTSTTNGLEGSYVQNDTLFVKASKEGRGRIGLKICSNGQLLDETIEVSVKGSATGINSVFDSSSKEIVEIYSLDGQRIPELRKGINIVKYSDGSVKKVLK